VLPLLASLVVLAAASLLLWLIRPHRFRHIGWLAALPPAGVTAWLITQIPAVAAGHTLVETYPWAPQLGLEVALRLDGLGLFFGLIIAGIGAAIALYTGYYFDDEPRHGFFYSQIFLFMASMLGLVWSDNLLLLFVFWEGTSITSYLLIAFKDTDRAAQDGGRRAFLVTAGGGLAMLFGMLLLGAQTGTLRISEILATAGLIDAPLTPTALVLIFLGALSKSAQFPFHFWLPGAMAAPTPASAYLHSATMVKAGVFLLARLHPGLHDHPLWFWTLLIVGGVTMLLGAISALGYYDMKALLAYATVSQLGVFTLLLAFGTEEAYYAVVVGILAHALYKGPLFLLAGIIDHATGSRDLRRLANLSRSLPLVTGVALLAGLSMAGIPPLFGFLAKETLLSAFEHHAATAAIVGWTGLAIAAVAGAFSVGYALTLLWESFGRRQAVSDPVAVHHRPSLGFVLPPLALALVGTAVPFLLSPLGPLLFDPAASAIAGEPVTEELALWHGLNFLLLVSLAAIAAGVLIFLARDPIRRGLHAWPADLTGVRLYDRLVSTTYAVARWSTRVVQGGTLSQQASATLMAAVVVVAFALRAADWPADFPIDWSNRPGMAEVILALLAVVAAIVTALARSRLSAIISLGVVGVVVTLFFVFHSAPDLALTQLLVDILSVVLLVLVFYRVPARPLPPLHRAVWVRNLVVSFAVGLIGFAIVMATTGEPYFPSIADYFLLNSIALGHGANVVNVILVDFRGFDTLGEITVLGIAAVGGYAIFRATLLRPRPPAQPSQASVKGED
jgi:multicomponent Na+:H+ antiporter subunit A